MIFFALTIILLGCAVCALLVWCDRKLTHSCSKLSMIGTLILIVSILWASVVVGLTASEDAMWATGFSFAVGVGIALCYMP